MDAMLVRSDTSLSNSLGISKFSSESDLLRLGSLGHDDDHSALSGGVGVAMSNCLSESNLDRMVVLPSDDEDDDGENSLKPRQVGPKSGLHVLFLSSDTGGGHRASAESLGKQFELLFPGSTYELVDVVGKDAVPPYNFSLSTAYKHLSNRPSQWKFIYSVSNSRPFEIIADAHLKLMCERAVRRRIRSHNPDVVVSVHPMMTTVPVLSCAKISAETGRHLPIFTVVTDLGSAHCLWFANGIEKMFVGSEAIKELAKTRGKVPDEKLILSGLPIRHDFAVQAELLGDRYSNDGRAYQRKIRNQLNLPKFNPQSDPTIQQPSSTSQSSSDSVDRATLLIMGGGEGVGSLENITEALFLELTSQGIDALILVVCGRNEKLKLWLEHRDWTNVYQRWESAKNRGRAVTSRGIMSSLSLAKTCGGSTADVDVVGSTTALDASTAGCIDPPVTVTNTIRALIERGTRSVGNAMGVPRPRLSFETKNNDDPTVNNHDGEADEAVSIGEDINKGNHDDGDDELISREEFEKVKERGLAEDTKHTIVSTLSQELPHPTLESVISKGPLSYDLVNSLAEVERRAAIVTVVGLGFIDQMADYMVAADILITKAGPGTISEAAALSLPVMLTSYLPGQEEGNIDFVINAGFGEYCDVSDPSGIAEEVCIWLQDEEKMKTMSENAKAYGKPYAARDIVKVIGESTLRWLEHNHEVELERIRRESLHLDKSSTKDSIAPPPLDYKVVDATTPE